MIADHHGGGSSEANVYEQPFRIANSFPDVVHQAFMLPYYSQVKAIQGIGLGAFIESTGPFWRSTLPQRGVRVGYGETYRKVWTNWFCQKSLHVGFGHLYGH